MRITCLSIDCPERTGGKCQFDDPSSEANKKLSAFIAKQKVLDPATVQLIDDNLFELF